MDQTTIEAIKNLRSEGLGERSIARRLGIGRYLVTKVINPHHIVRKLRREAETRSHRKYRDQRVMSQSGPPPTVAEERNRAYSVPQNLMGDPPLGRSALERRLG